MGSLRIFKRKNVMIGLSIFSVFVFLAIFAPWLAPNDPIEINLANSLSPPSREHPFGYDLLGRDILSRVIFGARTSLAIGIMVITLALAIGLLLGVTAGYCGGLIDEIVMRCIDILMSFPGVLLALAFVAALGPSMVNLMIAVGISNVPSFTRVVRAVVISAKENEYVEAARAIGESNVGIVLRYILPNCVSPIIVQSTLRMGTAILWASSLSFLGLGVQPPTPEWGADLSDGRIYLTIAPHIAIIPGLALFFMVLGLNLLGDGLRDALDVRLRV